MGAGWTRMIVWLPRVLGLVFVAFLSMFALDVFAEGVPLKEALVGLLVHLIPNFLILIGIGIAWGRPLLGGLALIGLGALALWFYGPEAVLIVAAPLAVLGVLFIAGELFLRRGAPAGA
ncbi:MAG: hypothetical protein GXX93_12225 [Anaerolineae bacterium]|nr:hypothetical protein [Anaerolineae bacterium]